MTRRRPPSQFVVNPYAMKGRARAVTFAILEELDRGATDVRSIAWTTRTPPSTVVAVQKQAKKAARVIALALLIAERVPPVRVIRDFELTSVSIGAGGFGVAGFSRRPSLISSRSSRAWIDFNAGVPLPAGWERW